MNFEKEREFEKTIEHSFTITFKDDGEYKYYRKNNGWYYKITHEFTQYFGRLCHHQDLHETMLLDGEGSR
jgi:hypothetical protein